MTVIRAFKLVLDQHPGVRADVLAQDIRAERTDGLLLRLEFQVNSQGLGKNGEVFLARKPGREVGGLADPDLAQIDADETERGI